MRVSLNYTGFLRSWQQCKGNHYDNVWVNKPDFYFYTESDPFRLLEERELKLIMEPGIKAKFNQDQNPVFYPDPFQHHRYHERKVPENTYYQTMRQWHCGFIGFCLIPQGYDIYVRIRPDIVLSGPINFADYDCSGKTIYIPQGNDFGGINDQFAFGNHEVMKIYYSIYQTHHELWHEGATFHSEGMQLANLNKHGVNIVRIGSPQINIVR